MHHFTKYKRTKKVIALTLALSMLNAALFPTYTWALGSGAGQPEYASFEPVDATDMVNLLTGDFSYNIPVINIPGPEGGYPLSMFYHAGIGPEQEASWLGLGWNINPGSINRFAKGVPDDWNEKVTSVVSYNEPNTAYDWAASTGYSFGGIGGGISLDGASYKSTGGSVNFAAGGYHANIGTKGAAVGFGPLSIGTSGVSVGGPLGYGLSGAIRTDYSGNVSGNASVGTPGVASVGVNMSSKGSTTYASVANQTVGLGTNAVSNSDLTMKTFSAAIAVAIPTPYGVFSGSASYNHYKYWLWKMDNKYNYGSLYIANAKHEVSGSGGQQLPNFISDSYENPYNAINYKNAQHQAQSTALSFPNYDGYQVSGQGIGGSISPKIFEFGSMTREAVEFSKYMNGDTKEELMYYNKDNFSKPIYFQFDYDQGGYSKVVPGSFSFLPACGCPMWYSSYDGTGSYNYSGGSLDVSNNGLSYYNTNITKQRAGTSKYIEYFTNEQIHTDVATARANGFIETESQQGLRWNTNLYDAKGIGAFSITAEDGKTYHYSIPVYQFEEFQVFEQRTNPHGQYLENRKLNMYAYDWLLTSVTGPDFVDRGTPGVIDDQDYGYWVKFDYGKWTDGYVWRSPYNDGEWSPSSAGQPYGAYSFGRKQIYYLNNIKTKTHTAYFIKSLREDAKGKSMDYSPDNTYHITNKKNYSGGFICGQNLAGGQYIKTIQETEQIVASEKNQQLKLDKIILLNNSDIAAYTNALSGNNNGTNNFKTTIESQFLIKETTRITAMNGALAATCDRDLYDKSFSSYFQENVLDVKDVQDNISAIEQKALKVIEFNQDYSLCKNTPNSSATGGGKLTLNSVKIYGHGKADILPSYNFAYNNQSSNPILYDKNKIDYWGYYAVAKPDFYKKGNADAWSLNEITTPLGGKIKINYESDTYSREAVFRSPELNRVVGNSPIKNGSTMTLTASIYGLDDIGALVIGNYYPIRSRISTSPLIEGVISKKLLSYNISAGTLTFEENGTATHPIPLSVVFQSYFNFGGGTRVKEILLNDGVGNSYKTSYSYNNPNSNISSGVTSFAPKIEDRYIPYIYELPGPMVMYEYVTVEDKGLTNDSYLKTRYKFDVLKWAQDINSVNFSLGDHLKVQNIQPTKNIQYYTMGQFPRQTYARSGLVTDNKSAIGRILEVATLNKANLVQDKVTYQYLNPTETDIKNGITQETFNDIKRYITWDNSHYVGSSIFSFTSSSRITYPSVLKSITSESNGITNKITNTKYDFYTGIPTETQSENSSGEKYHTKTLPAYANYGSIETDMGSKVYNVNNKNMLVQGAASYLYSGEAVNNANLLSASVQTWKKDWNYREYISSEYVDDGQADVWRKYKTYVWKADVYNDGKVASFTDFNWTSTPNAGWQKTNEVTRYDHYSEAIESKDINGNYTAIKKGGLNGNFVIASSGASNYNSFVHSSFEDLLSNNYFGGEVSLGGGEYLSTPMLPAHTGKYLVKIHGTEYGPSYSVKENLQTGRTYRASVWVHQMSSSSTKLVANLDGEVGTPININEFMNITDPRAIHAGNWILLSVNISVPQGYVHAGGGLNVYVYNPGSTDDAYIDDMRLQPVNSPVTGYVYDERKGVVTAMLDNENFATYFTYDAANRLIKTEKESTLGIKKVSESWYHYGRP